jgi:GTP cyclohydrolase I
VNSGLLPTAGLCNEAVEISGAQRLEMTTEAAKAIERLFDVLRVDYRNDDNTRDTPRRVAAMYVEELLQGRYTKPPAITAFENATSSDQLIVTGPIDLRSTCAHHLMPIYGEAYLGILPSASRKIIGLSKYDRIVQYFAARLQVQESLVSQIGQYIMDVTKPRGLAVRISAVHMCKTHRGVRSSHRSRMVNNCFFGEFLTSSALRNEFLEECHTLDHHSST